MQITFRPVGDEPCQGKSFFGEAGIGVMKKPHYLYPFTCLFLAAGLAGCYESPRVTLSDAGVYKGAQDPLLLADTAARAETLQQRFRLALTDR